MMFEQEYLDNQKEILLNKIKEVDAVGGPNGVFSKYDPRKHDAENISKIEDAIQKI